MKTFNNLKEIRDERRMSVRALAKLSGVGCSTVSKIENGEMNPTQITMLKISRGLKMNTEDVFNLDWGNIDIFN